MTSGRQFYSSGVTGMPEKETSSMGSVRLNAGSHFFNACCFLRGEKRSGNETSQNPKDDELLIWLVAPPTVARQMDFSQLLVIFHGH